MAQTIEATNESATCWRWRCRIARGVLVAGIAVWLVNALARWWLAVPLGHDEARYALDAQDLLAHAPRRFVYSGGGMTLVGIPGLLLGGSERALRALPLLLGAGFLASAWYLARRVCGPETAAWTIGVLAGARSMATHSAELLSDLPSTACLLVAIRLASTELARHDGPRKRLVGVAPLCAAAFYLRYGSCVAILVLALVFFVSRHREMRARPGPVVATFLLMVVLPLPHIILSVIHTGSPIGVLRISAAIPGAASAIAAYVERPFAMYGLLVTPLMIIGVLAARQSQALFALQAIAIMQLVVLALTTQAQPRYVFVATVLLVVLGVDALRKLMAAVRSGLVPSVLGVVAVTSLWGHMLWSVGHYDDVKAGGPTARLIAAAMIASDRAGTPCQVVVTDRGPADLTRVEWYSGCRAVHAPTASVRLYEVRSGLDASMPTGSVMVGFVPGVVGVVRY